ncbi:hypothetical protein EXIGLDRAFT_769459 [Exidia glandulosa HHB12029]|uniref:F-box domain-containing protein n=1 Tax=Exidia glandulosa HHB12029 TaxID=1314781 RepID=A0A165HGZ5_EXIGL|nr:hypothetical protein EXIGLDRAFT_769459 [Exidia glandulosa HHB12029]
MQKEAAQRQHFAIERAPKIADVAAAELDQPMEEHIALVTRDTPVLRLPYLALVPILSDYVRHIDVEEKGPCAQPSFAAASVCRAWRDIMISTPSLWPVLRLKFGQGVIRHAAEYVHLVLQRSDPLPLSVYLEVPFKVIDANSVALLEDLLPNVVARAGYLDIWQHPPQDDEPHVAPLLGSSVLKFLWLPTPFLHSLTIRHYQVQGAILALLPSTPKLVRLDLHYFDPLHLFSPDAYAKLRRIDLHSSVDEACIQLLSTAAPEIEYLRLSAIHTVGPPGSLRVSPLKNLRTLSIDTVDDISPFPTDAFPALHSLYLEYPLHDTDLGHQLPALPLLHTLRVTCYDSTTAMWETTLSLILHVPSIHRLELVGPENSATFWTELLAPTARAAPNLRTLHIEDEDFETSDEIDAFLHFVKSRTARTGERLAGSTSLARLEFFRTRNVSKITEGLKSYIEPIIVDEHGAEVVIILLVGYLALPALLFIHLHLPQHPHDS